MKAKTVIVSRNLFSLICLSLFVGCQTDSPSNTKSSSLISNVPSGQVGSSAASPRYSVPSDTLRVGDPISIRLNGVPVEEEKLVEDVVDGEGNISMPLVGRFKAAGLSSAQLKLKIEQAYRDRKLYATPNITIIVQQRYVNLAGEVRIPQRVPFTSDMTVLRAITACGGFTDYADRRKVIILRGNDVFEFDAKEALLDPSKDVPMVAGDQIQVPRTIF
ncbi:MAG: polysaccharide biosynthesis/export family protein [Verrucomicrobiota bacterium]